MWQTTLVSCVAVVCGTIAWIVYEVERYSSHAPCVEQVFDPSAFNGVRCDDPRARITTPPGWTWLKCECPKESP